MAITEIWSRIDTWIASNDPELIRCFHDGATEAKIKEVEEFMGVTFPESVRESYRIHNGTEPTDYEGESGLFYGFDLLSLAGIKHYWERESKHHPDGNNLKIIFLFDILYGVNFVEGNWEGRGLDLSSSNQSSD